MSRRNAYYLFHQNPPFVAFLAFSPAVRGEKLSIMMDEDVSFLMEVGFNLENFLWCLFTILSPPECQETPDTTGN